MNYAKIASELREKIIKFSGELSSGLPKVARHFITEALYGIQARKSVRLIEIARIPSSRVLFRNIRDVHHQ